MKKSILIADDNLRIRRILIDFFKGELSGIDVHEAFDGTDALEKVLKMKPDLIVLDLSMPRLNGLQAARKMREMNVDAPIIMFTIYADQIPATAITSAQLNAVVLKPDLTCLHQHVEFFLNRQYRDKMEIATQLHPAN